MATLTSAVCAWSWSSRALEQAQPRFDSWQWYSTLSQCEDDPQDPLTSSLLCPAPKRARQTNITGKEPRPDSGQASLLLNSPANWARNTPTINTQAEDMAEACFQSILSLFPSCIKALNLKAFSHSPSSFGPSHLSRHLAIPHARQPFHLPCTINYFLFFVSCFSSLTQPLSISRFLFFFTFILSCPCLNLSPLSIISQHSVRNQTR